MFVLDCIYKFCSCVHEQWYSVILVCCSLKPWLDPGYSCLLASETRAFSTFFGSHERKSNATLKQSYQQTLGLRSGKCANSLLILSKKSNKTHQKSPIPWLPYPVPTVPAPALAMGNLYHQGPFGRTYLVRRSRAISRGNLDEKKNPNFPGDGGRCDRSVPGAGYSIFRYTICIYCICISYHVHIRRYIISYKHNI